VQQQQAAHHLVTGQLQDQVFFAPLLHEADDSGEAVAVQRQQRLNGFNRCPLGRLIGERFQLLDERFGLCEPLFELLLQR
jgi:hypothetical protein